MEITKEMYKMAKKVVDEYEGTAPYTEAKEKMEEVFEANNYNNPFEDGPVMPCCGRRYVFSYATMKYMTRNPKLKYRETEHDEGEIDHDPESSHPKFVQYNNCREAIRQAKEKGYDHVHWRTSTACDEAISADGYIVHNDSLDTISWKNNKGIFSFIRKNKSLRRR